jgi:NDP-sugar pyrophosphorylase family protein
MNALIFAAGLGTRLAQVAQDKPKALVQVAEKPMLLHAIEKLTALGVKRIVINVHHHAEKIEELVSKLAIPQVDIVLSNERDELLETGGGLLKAAPLFIPDKSIILYNADVLTGANLKDMINFHHQKGGIATLMVKNRTTSRYFLFDSEMRLSGWENRSTHEKRITRDVSLEIPLAFSGIHIVNYEILSLLGELRKFSITQGYLDLSSHYKIFGWDKWEDYWFDIGTPEKLRIANDFFINRNT